MIKKTRAGYIALTGRPNAGKSTLLNYLVQATIAIATAKPQTTRHVIRGMTIRDTDQFVFFDTPGMHRPKDLLGGVMMKDVNSVISDADVVIVMVEADAAPSFDDVERLLIRKIMAEDIPAVLAINKIDKVKKQAILPLIDHYRNHPCFKAFVPISAATGQGVEALLAEVASFLPTQAWLFEADDFTDQTEKDLAAELIRRELVLQLRKELPYGIAVKIVSFEEKVKQDNRRKIVIEADIICDRHNHKGMVVGRKGARIKAVGQAARANMITLFDADVTVFLQVRVQEKWRESVTKLDDLGFS